MTDTYVVNKVTKLPICHYRLLDFLILGIVGIAVCFAVLQYLSVHLLFISSYMSHVRGPQVIP
jgi:multisubunit Na+/H+ antiporter MnhB subunit